ncbi:MAG: EF-hand domain-containing protein [Planctomycetes bacterium]|nr:EF-hand domain-containing protein [Planctomycetota bacterium]
MLSTMVSGMLMAALAAQDGKSPQEEALKRISTDLARQIKAADADGNGTLSLAEFRVFAPALQKAAEAILNEIDPTIAQKKAAKNLKKYDASADGKLDESEKKAMDEALRLKSIKEFDWDGDGKLDEREKQAQQWATEGRQAGAFRAVDTDANGQLTQEEISAALPLLTGIKVKKAK